MWNSNCGKNRISSILFLIVFVLSSSIFPQKSESKNAKELRVWRERVQELTNGILNDTKSVGSDRSLYLALLAKIWWKIEPTEARKYLKTSVEVLLSELDSDDKNSFSSKVKGSEKIIKIIAGLDEPLGRSLVEQIAKIVAAKGGDGDLTADSFVTIGLQILPSNPTLAFNLGVRSLSYGNSKRLNILIQRLFSKDSKLGEELFQHSVAACRRNYSYEFTGNLGLVVFDVVNGKTFSDATRVSYLEVLADFLSNAAIYESGRSRCEVIGLINPILAQFDAYLPSRSLTVRQQIQVCIPFTDSSTSEIAKAQARGEDPQTTEDLIRAARNTSDRRLKSRYFSKAISKLAHEKKFDEIISLLDDMTEDETKIMAYAWDDWRVDFAYQSLLVYIENKDMATVYRIINRTPRRLRPYVRFRLVHKLTQPEFGPFILENLEDIRKELDALEVPAKDAASSYLALTGLYVKTQPIESEGVFRQAVKYINKTDSENSNFLPEKDYAPLQDYVPLSSQLLEVDEHSIFRSLSNISVLRSRIRLRLGLLESSLKKFADLQVKVGLENAKNEK
jgi:hypothetical protein